MTYQGGHMTYRNGPMTYRSGHIGLNHDISVWNASFGQPLVPWYIVFVSASAEEVFCLKEFYAHNCNKYCHSLLCFQLYVWNVSTNLYWNMETRKTIKSKHCFSINCVCRKCVGFCNPQQEGAPRGKMHQTNVLTKLPRTILSFFILAFNLGSPLNTLGPQGVPPLLQTKFPPRNELRVKGVPATCPLRTIYKDDHRNFV